MKLQLTRHAGWMGVLGALCLLHIPEGFTQQVANALEDNVDRPRIGLVLGGGGARGLAHVGVLKILEDMQVPVDCIVGTSMGALVGATYAAGASADEIEAALLDIDWGKTLGEQGLRDQMPIEEKLFATNYTNALSLGISGGRLRGRSALVSSQSVEELLTQLVASAQFTSDFNELPIPFRAIATDMLKGEMVILGEGELTLAMRASMAMPGVFSPVELDEKLLADGGMIRNLPVDIARELCADVVIAVWLEWPLPDVEEVQSTIGMLNRAMEVMVKANEKEQIATLTERDIGIAVPVGSIAVADFTRVAEAIDFGEQAGTQYRDSLTRYSLPQEQYSEWAGGVRVTANETYLLSEVEITGLDRVNSAYVESQLVNISPGATLTVAELVEDTQRIYALGDFERVEYRLSGPENERVIEVQGVEKSWGPDFVSFDYGIANLSGADLNAIIRLDHERTWMNPAGGRWHNVLQIGRQAIVSSDFYQPLDVAQRFYVRPQARFESRFQDVYEAENKVAIYDMRELYGQIDLGANVATHTQFSLGVRHGWQSANVETGQQALPLLDREIDSTLEFRVIHDTRDAVSLPNHGRYFSLRYTDSQAWFGSDLDYSMLEGVLSRHFSVDGNSLGIILGGADTLSGVAPVSQLIEVGGVRTFPGLRPGELRGSRYWFAGTSYSWRVMDFQPILGQALYAGFRLQVGEIQDEFYGSESDLIYGLSGSLSARTPIGPVLLSLGWAKGGQALLQFSLGRPMSEGSLLDRVQ